MTSVTDTSMSHNIKGLTEESGNKLPLSFDHDGSHMDKENNELAAPDKEASCKGTKTDQITPSVKSPTIMASSSSSAAPISGNQDEELRMNMAKATAADEMASVVRTPKRRDYLSWEDFFMGVAVLSSKRSKDPISPTGACLVDKQQRIVGIGYNGFPRGCSDDVLPWTTGHSYCDGDLPWLHTKEGYMVHAVTNAILNKCSHDVEGCSLYVTQFPCSDCAKMIIQSRISKVVVRLVDDGRSCHGCNSTLPLLTKETENEEPIDPDTRASQILLEMAGVHVQYYRPTVKSVTIDFGRIAPSGSTCKSETDACACAGEDNKQERGNIKEASPSSSKDEYNQDENKNEHCDDEFRNRAYQLLWQEANYDPRISPPNKRKDYISWSEYFMAMAFLTAQRSKDPNTQVGACIVDPDKRIVGLGYNGFPRGCSDNELPWAKVNDNPLHNKYLYVCHAEVNAILNKGSANVKGSTIYVALFPCQNCAKMIIQAGIKEVVYSSDKNHDSDGCRASRIMLQLAGVKLRRYVPPIESIVLNFTEV